MKSIIALLIILACLGAFAITISARVPTDSIIIDGADDSTTYTLTSSPDLITLIRGVAPRFVLRFADDNALYALTPVSSELLDLITSIADRFVLRFADNNHLKQLAYPVDLVNDNTPPLITDINTHGVGLIAWTTDEFATSAVDFGIATGQYTGTVSSASFTKQHEITLSGLQTGTTYYFVTRSTDRSGNTATSEEHTLRADIFIYLPAVIRS